MAYNRHRAPPESDRDASEGDENLGEITGSRQLRGVLLKEPCCPEPVKSASTKLIGESKAGLHPEKVGVVEGRCFNRLGIGA